MIRYAILRGSLGISTYAILMMFMLWGCQGEQDTNEENGVVDQTEQDTVDEDMPVPDLCSKIGQFDEIKEVRDYIYTWESGHRQLGGKEYIDLLKRPCLRDKFLMGPAEFLCDCTNEYGQASLECDAVYERLRGEFAKRELEAIEEIYVEMECGE